MKMREIKQYVRGDVLIADVGGRDYALVEFRKLRADKLFVEDLAGIQYIVSIGKCRRYDPQLFIEHRDFMQDFNRKMSED
jgi:hypothetical protein